ncbi:Nipped-B-like protein [Amphibalanus amphitrite]|uniref:Nipped-B protein n=1 Tax=Amphibalanus amphitrite TaxID=1232801 RepID=A0A6A4UTR9_AMPAM|nr:Nipped-B-like protein [Amphibalanus amphitrite]
MHLSAKDVVDGSAVCSSPARMNGELPNANTPVTTLAGMFSLSDLLPELPLPTPMEASLSSRSLLFHPRVAEEARRLLTVRDSSLVPQLAQALTNTSAEHIELKEPPPAETASSPALEPELLRALRQLDSQLLSHPAVTNHTAERTGSPAVAAAAAATASPAGTPAPPPAKSPAAAGGATPARPDTASPASAADRTVPSVADGAAPPAHAEKTVAAEQSAADKLTVDGPAAGEPPPGAPPPPPPPAPPVVRVASFPWAPQDEALMKKCLEDLKKVKQSESSGAAGRGARRFKCNEVSSESEEEDRPRNKYFKAKEKERDLAKKKEKEERKRKRQDGDNQQEEDAESAAKRIKREEELVERIKNSKRFERRLVPTLEKLSAEELMETNTYQRFNQSLELILDDEDDDVPQEALIQKYRLQELVSEAAKLKSLGAMESVPPERLVRALGILEMNVRDGAQITPLGEADDGEEESRLWMEIAMERVARGADASLVIMYILTSPGMPKRVYLEDCIERVVKFMKFQLQNTVYPAFDPVYRAPSKKGAYAAAAAAPRRSAPTPRTCAIGSILSLYNKLRELVALTAELLNIQVLTDTTVLQVSSLGVAPFFVENISELQLSALKLVTTIFSKYQKHRRLLLDDILASIARLPSSKRSLRTYKLNSSGPGEADVHIQMLTALVLQLIQCVVVLPNYLAKTAVAPAGDQEHGDEEKEIEIDRDVLIMDRYDTAMRTAHSFLSVFLQKCGSKNEEIDYRPLFENFIQDLLATVNKPEWPAAECLLSLLGKLLVANFSNKSKEMALRVSSLDYLGVVAARLRRDAVTSTARPELIEEIISEVKREERAAGLGAPQDEKETPAAESKKEKKKKKKHGDSESPGGSLAVTDAEEERTRFLQRVLLDYLAVSAERDPALLHCRHFYLAQWYKEAPQEILRQKQGPQPTASPTKRHKKRRKRRGSDSSDEESEESDEEADETAATEEMKREVNALVEGRRQLLLTKVAPFGETGGKVGIRTLQTYLDYDHAELLCKYLASKRPFSRSFDVYLKQDTGVSVRKRVIKIMKDICVECPDFPKIPEICVKMIRRVNDEEGIRKLVMEVFQLMWFTPVREQRDRREQQDDSNPVLLKKVMDITDVVVACRETGLDWFEQLLNTLFKPKEDKEDSTKVVFEPPKSLLTASRQIVDCLVQHILRIEESGLQDRAADTGAAVSRGSSQRLVACLNTLYMFARIRPQLLVPHAITLQPYLAVKCQTRGDYQIISHVARTLELVVPLIEHPSDTFLAELEEDSVKLILQHDKTVVASCLACLGSIVNRVTKNFKLIRDCFRKYYGHLKSYKLMHESQPTNPMLEKHKPYFRRALYTVGLLLRYFDFGDEEVRKGLNDDIVDEVLETLLYFVNQPAPDMQMFTLQALGFIVIRHYDMMLSERVKQLYHGFLQQPDVSKQLKAQVLINLETYLVEEERRMIQQDEEWSKRAKEENLKEMGDVSSGMASTVIQLYLKQVLGSFLDASVAVRHAALKVIQLILAQGLVHPVQIVPYLICMSTDPDERVSHTADKQLQEIEKKYPGFIQMKATAGIRLSFELQKILQAKCEVTRGLKLREGEPPAALNGFLYSIMRTSKQQRRAIAISCLRNFDEHARKSLQELLYLADNLAYFPYQVADEVLFIIHQVDVMVSVTGSTILQLVREALLPPAGQPVRYHPETGQPIPYEDEDDDDEQLLERLPDDSDAHQGRVSRLRGIKISQYSPSESGKAYEKAVNRRATVVFKPAVTIKSIKAQEREGAAQKVREEDGEEEEEEEDSEEDEAKRKLISQYLNFKRLMLHIDPADEDDEDDRPAAPGGSALRPVPGTPSVSATPQPGRSPRGDGAPPPAAPPPPPPPEQPAPPQQPLPPIILSLSALKSQAAAASAAESGRERREGRHHQTAPRTPPAAVEPPRVAKLTIVPLHFPGDEAVMRHHKHKHKKSDKHKKKKKKKKRRDTSDDEDGDSDGGSDPDFAV